MKKIVLDFLCALEGYHSLLRSIHWNTKNRAEHDIADEITEKVLEYQDLIAEVTMGLTKSRFNVGSLKAMLPNAKDLASMIEELNEDILKLKKAIGNDPKNAGLQNVLDDMAQYFTWSVYMETFK